MPEDVSINLPLEVEEYRSLEDGIIQMYQKPKTERNEKPYVQFHWMVKTHQLAFCAFNASFQNVI